MAAVSETRIRHDVDTLAGFGTRHTLSETESDARGIGAARRWIRSQFDQAGGRLEGSFEAFDQPPARRLPRGAYIVNVIATLPGEMPEAADRVIVVSAHYDSRASDPVDGESDAPGANDDASGVALLLELARVLADEPLDATVMLVAMAGEEQGLFGARHHAASAARRGVNIEAVLNNDTIGDPTTPWGADESRRVRVFSEGVPVSDKTMDVETVQRLGAEMDSPSRALARYIREVARAERTRIRPMLVFRTDRFLRGGDHKAFLEQGYPAVRFTEVGEEYARQHQDVRVENGVEYGDLPEFVSAEYIAGVTQLNGAVVVHLANAPRPPANVRMIVAALTNDTTLRWDPVPEPDLAGYEVVWRDTTRTWWTDSRRVPADQQEITLPLSKDTHFFGVRAVDRDGYRSPVSFAGSAEQ